MSIIEEHHTDDRHAELEGMTKRELVEIIEGFEQLERDAGLSIEDVWVNGPVRGFITSFTCPAGYGATVTVEVPQATGGDALTLSTGSEITIIA